jgi:hypothetical protein
MVGLTQQMDPAAQFACPVHFSTVTSGGFPPPPASGTGQVVPVTHALVLMFCTLVTQQTCVAMLQNARPHGSVVVLPPGPPPS